MAWGEKWIIGFKSLDGRSYAVKIYDKDYTGAVEELTGSGQPFTTSENDDSDIFSTIRYQTGYIRIETQDMTLMKRLMPPSNTYRMVRLWEGYWSGSTFTEVSVRWQGFMQAQAFDQPWNGGSRILEFPVQSILGCMRDVEMDKSYLSTRGDIGKMIHTVLSETSGGAGYDDIFGNVICITPLHVPNDWLNAEIMWSLFFEREEVDNEGNQDYETFGSSYYDIMDSVLRLFGLTMREDGRDIYLADYTSVVPGDSRKMRQNVYAFSDLITEEKTNTEETTMDVSVDSAVTDANGPTCKIGYLLGRKAVRVTIQISQNDIPAISLPRVTEDDSQLYSRELQDGEIFIQRHAARTASEAFYYKYWNTQYQYQVGNDTINDCWNYSSMNAASPSPVTTGAIPVRWFFRKNDSYDAVVLANGLLFTLMNYELITNGYNDHNFCYDIWNDNILMSGGYINIQFEMHDFYYEYFDWGSQHNVTYSIRCVLTLGDKIWDADNNQWITGSDGYAFSIDFKNQKVISNKTADVSVDVDDGYFIPVHGDMVGRLRLRILNRFSASNIIGTRTKTSFIMSNLDVIHVHEIDDTASQRGSNTYYHSLMKSGFSSDRVIETNIGTFNNNRPSHSFLLQHGTTGNKWLTSMEYDQGGTTRLIRPELYLLNRMAIYFAQVRQTMIQDCDFPVDMYKTRYTYDGKKFIAIDKRHEWNEDIQTIKFVEI